MSKDDTSAMLRPTRITVWRRNYNRDDEAGDTLPAGVNDRIFRVDRSGTESCARLVSDRTELATVQHE
ncbi:conserved exported hypothetical protein [Bradyrhizobium oligotrophicum S58]|uniref:Uncharacterized protein n=1 Tax=Bradyrhizobium oligotrophicum S58 TaxID=1245469 RepID=M4Z3A3_9BRAD|nr:hypothetical protein [Bradyrhizobium oligotrophicum]BAM87818.1 conserved exported hypothetical protein [Bradyrhizobium oligotrophicum S58]